MSNDSRELDALTLRIEKLERQSRTLRRLLFAVVVVAGALAFMAQANPTPRTVIAHDFVVHNDQGKEIARLNADGLLLFDSHGEAKLRAFTDDTLGGVLLAWAERTNQTIGVTGSQIVMKDKNDKIQSFLNRDALGLHEENGKVAVQLSVGEGMRGLSVLDESGFSVMVGKLPLQNLATGNGETGSAASITMFNSDGRVIWRAP